MEYCLEEEERVIMSKKMQIHLKATWLGLTGSFWCHLTSWFLYYKIRYKSLTRGWTLLSCCLSAHQRSTLSYPTRSDAKFNLVPHSRLSIIKHILPASTEIMTGWTAGHCMKILFPRTSHQVIQLSLPKIIHGRQRNTDFLLLSFLICWLTSIPL